MGRETPGKVEGHLVSTPPDCVKPEGVWWSTLERVGIMGVDRGGKRVQVLTAM